MLVIILKADWASDVVEFDFLLLCGFFHAVSVEVGVWTICALVSAVVLPSEAVRLLVLDIAVANVAKRCDAKLTHELLDGCILAFGHFSYHGLKQLIRGKKDHGWREIARHVELLLVHWVVESLSDEVVLVAGASEGARRMVWVHPADFVEVIDSIDVTLVLSVSIIALLQIGYSAPSRALLWTLGAPRKLRGLRVSCLGLCFGLQLVSHVVQLVRISANETDL